MKRFINRKVVAVAVTVGLVAGGGGIAFAYFSGSGTGTGQASTGSISTADFTISGSTSGPALLPGSGSQDVSFVATNTGTGSEYLNNVIVSVANDGSGNVLDQNGDAVIGCQADWYSVSTSSVTVGLDVAAGASTDSIPAGTVSMIDPGVNQDLCQGVSVQLAFVSS